MRIYHVDVPRFSLLLAAIDVAVVAATINLATAAGFGQQAASDVPALVWCVFAPAFTMGLYQRSFLQGDKLVVRALGTLTAALVLSVAAAHAGIISRFDAFTAALDLAGAAALIANRLVVVRLADAARFKSRVMVVGAADTTRTMTELEGVRRPARFACVASFATSPDEPGAPDAIVSAARLQRIDEIVIDADADETLARALLTCRLSGVRVSTLASFIERETRRIEIDDREAVRLIVSDGSQRGTLSRLAKRAIDLGVSAAVLAFTAPLFAAVALAVRLADGGPVFYQQDRVGLGGRVFSVLKFRTMRVDAEADGVARWADKRDSRLTAIGGLLRLTRVDELPQLVNVLRGDMSLVGPRPERPQIVVALEGQIPLYAYRHLTPPGLTGWAQINYPYGASLEDAREKTRYDLYYMKNGSLIMDLVIMLQTVRVVLMAEGSR